ncbi:hypothetical protein GCM10010965_06150 [Caldalkalibacillus thermarum]|uniref:hypothetical protein n=1 Tax=Caldalkalibacillus thermarum TaxID=296745 RepID=UPI00166348B0|nr:hypothetical protein [Caldalkalibacillus thermarum]GGK15903.1 hypothetical protein GCM10010965_06150 [Caldalkalibacillus thermarum]
MWLIDKQEAPALVRELVLNEYDLYPHKTTRVGRVFKLACPQGTFALKETAASVQQLRFLARWFEQFNQKDQFPLIPFYPNKFGDPFVCYLDRLYYVTPWLNDDFEAKYRMDWEPSVLTALGRLHRFTLTRTSLVQKPLEALTQMKMRWQKLLSRMEQYRRKAEQKPLCSPLEGSFLLHFDSLHQRAVRSIVHLEAWLERGKGEYCWPLVLCHGRLTRPHVVFKHGKCYLINFDHSKMAHPVLDLVPFFRRHFAHPLSGRAKDGLTWLAAYENQFPLNRFDKGLLAILLLFPEGPFTEIDMYYQKKKDLPPLKCLHRFEKELERLRHLRRLAKALLHTTSNQSAEKG